MLYKNIGARFRSTIISCQVFYCTNLQKKENLQNKFYEWTLRFYHIMYGVTLVC